MIEYWQNEFDDRGYVHIRGVSDDRAAFKLASEIIASYEAKDHSPWRRYYTGLKRVETNIVPSVDKVDAFQGLHFDNGQNLFPNNTQEVVCFTILFGKEASSANTRVVQLSRALPLGLDTVITELENRILKYGESFGSGWDGEDKYRVSSFSRFIDAILQEGKLTNFNATPRSDWFTKSYFGNEFPSRRHEQDYFLSCGIDIEAITDRVQIAPSDVLIGIPQKNWTVFSETFDSVYTSVG